jgi:arylsulfatase A-like enzyme
MATCADIAEAKYPSDKNGSPVLPMEGISLLPAFRGGKLKRAKPMFWEHEGNRAIRQGRWKLVARFPETWELYDLELDRRETTDLAAKHPERVVSMADAWNRWAKRVNVLPWDEVRKCVSHQGRQLLSLALNGPLA